MSKAAKFPATIWDGSSDSRPNPAPESLQTPTDVYRGPDAADYQQALAEIIAIENALATTTLIAGAGNTATLANAATTGYAFIPRVNGAPTGVPANVPTGYIAWCYDFTNNKMYVYNGAWKASAALA